jgi:hypothetical protein
MTQGTTINADVYCETVSKLRRTIQNKIRGLLSSGFLLLHDNALRTLLLERANCSNNCNGKSSNTHPIALTLHPVTFVFFLHLKRFLAAELFSSDDEVKTAVQHWVRTLAADFFHEGIQKLVPRYDKYLSLDGDYVEK